MEADDVEMAPAYDERSGAYQTDYWELEQLENAYGQAELERCKARAKTLWAAVGSVSQITVAVVTVFDVTEGSPDTVFKKFYLVAMNGKYELHHAKSKKILEQLLPGEHLVPGVMPEIDAATSHAERNIVAYLKLHQNLAVLAVGADKGVCWVADSTGGCDNALQGVNKRRYWDIAPKPLYTKRSGQLSANEAKAIEQTKSNRKMEDFFKKT